MSRPSTEPPEKAQGGAEQKSGDLPVEFWRSLVDAPGCETTGVCNECGRCEH